MKVLVDNIEEILFLQLYNYWTDVDEKIVISMIPTALKAIEDNYKGLPNRRFWDENEVVFSPYMSVQWMNFLYRLSHVLYLSLGGGRQQIKFIT